MTNASIIHEQSLALMAAGLLKGTGKFLCYTDSGWITTLNWSEVHEAFNASDWKKTADFAVKVSHWCTLDELNLPKLDEDKEDEE